MTRCWLLFDYALLVIAVLAIIAIHRERKAHDRELVDRRVRTFQGGDLS